MATVMERVRLILNEHLGIALDRIVPDARLVEDLSADSLDITEIRFECEGEFRVNIEESEMQKAKTVADLVGLIDRIATAA